MITIEVFVIQSKSEQKMGLRATEHLLIVSDQCREVFIRQLDESQVKDHDSILTVILDEDNNDLIQMFEDRPSFVTVNGEKVHESILEEVYDSFEIGLDE